MSIKAQIQSSGFRRVPLGHKVALVNCYRLEVALKYSRSEFAWFLKNFEGQKSQVVFHALKCTCTCALLGGPKLQGLSGALPFSICIKWTFEQEIEITSQAASHEKRVTYKHTQCETTIHFP